MKETTSAVIKYQARDGQDITLSFETIKKYLVQGKAEYVTPQEFMYFMGVCKSQGMNPFKRDCWLIKYSPGDGAAIISAIGFLRSRAKAMTDCKGWDAGIIIKRGKDIIYSNGLMFEGDILLGGWARGKPEGWEHERVIEVNLNGYIKHTKEGNVTQFWKSEKQPTQIAKVAESQLLRALWPDEFQNIYTDAEISPGEGVQALPDLPATAMNEADGELPEELIKQFDASIPDKTHTDYLNTYLKMASNTFEKSVDEIKAEAAKDLDGFWKSFNEWQANQGKKDFDEKDPIRKQYIGLRKGDGVKTGLKPWVLSHLDYIPKLKQEYQDEIKEKWTQFYLDEPYPLDEPKTPTGPDPNFKPQEDPLLEEHVETTEEPKAEKKDPPFKLNCMLSYEERPEKDDNGRVNVEVCETCDQRNACVAYEKFQQPVLTDKEDGSE